MNRKQAFHPVTLASLALLTLGLSAGAAKAESNPIVVTRGPGGAAYIVDRVPLGATPLPNTAAHNFPQLIQRGPGGAVTISNHKNQENDRAQRPTKPSISAQQTRIDATRAAFLNNPDKG